MAGSRVVSRVEAGAAVDEIVQSGRDEALHSDQLYRLLVQSIRDYAIFMLDPEGRVLTWNEGAERIKRYRPEDIIGKHFSIFYPPHEIRLGKPEYALRVAAEEGRWVDEGWRVRGDGSRFWASVVITALHGNDQKLIGFAKVIRDLTDRKESDEERTQLLRLERAARHEMERTVEQLEAVQGVTEAALAHLDLDDLLHDLVHKIADILAVDTVAVLLVDEDAEDAKAPVLVARASKGLEEEVSSGVRIGIGRGFAGKILAEKRPVVLDHVDNSVVNPILLQKGVRSMLGVPLMIEDNAIGVLHVGALRTRHFTEADTQFLQVVATRAALAIDHGRLIQAARTAREVADVAEATVQARDEFLSVVAHELKTPITSLRIAAQMLLRQMHQPNAIEADRLERSLRAIDLQSIKLSRLVTQLLDRVRLQKGRLDLEMRQTDLVDLIKDVITSAQLTSDRHRVIFSAPDSMWAVVDPLRFEQVVTNILDNAVKFSPDGGDVTVKLWQDRNLIHLTVEDTGIGVEPDKRSSLFERFYQAHGSENRSGMGLGLYISREIMNMHGGTIAAEFPEDGGTRIVVAVPADEDRGSGVQMANDREDFRRPTVPDLAKA